jgi:hypothetical protein
MDHRSTSTGEGHEKTAAPSRHGDAPSFLANLTNFLQGQLKDLSDPYRLELHYVRGPGPKWQAKHDSTTEDFGVMAGLVRVNHGSPHENRN